MRIFIRFSPQKNPWCLFSPVIRWGPHWGSNIQTAPGGVAFQIRHLGDCEEMALFISRDGKTTFLLLYLILFYEGSLFGKKHI